MHLVRLYNGDSDLWLFPLTNSFRFYRLVIRAISFIYYTLNRQYICRILSFHTLLPDHYHNFVDFENVLPNIFQSY